MIQLYTKMTKMITQTRCQSVDANVCIFVATLALLSLFVVYLYSLTLNVFADVRS